MFLCCRTHGSAHTRAQKWQRWLSSKTTEVKPLEHIIKCSLQLTLSRVLVNRLSVLRTGLAMTQILLSIFNVFFDSKIHTPGTELYKKYTHTYTNISMWPEPCVFPRCLTSHECNNGHATRHADNTGKRHGKRNMQPCKWNSFCRILTLTYLTTTSVHAGMDQLTVNSLSQDSDGWMNEWIW